MMLKTLAAACLLALSLAPATLAQTTSSGKIRTIDPATNTLSIDTANGPQTYRYAPGTIEAAKLAPGSDILLTPSKNRVGTVVDSFRNYVRIRPDSAADSGTGEFIQQIFPPPYSYREGDRVVVLPDGKIVTLSNDVVGYLAPGDIVQASTVSTTATETSKPAETTTTTTTTTTTEQQVEQPVEQRPTTQPVAQPAPAPAETSQPVRALW